MRINKILNINSIVIKEDGVEKIVMGSGIAFQKSKNDLVDQSKIEKIFILKEENKKFQELLQSVPESHITLAEDIISYAEEKLELKLNDHIHIALTDHLSFALEREKNGIPIRNRLVNEIKNLYHQEYEIAIWGIEHVKNEIGVSLPIDEAAFIALHIHTAKMNLTNIGSSIKKTMIIQDMIDIISSYLSIDIDREGMDYQRLLTHLHFALARLEDNKPFHDMDKDMLNVIKTKYSESFECASSLASFLNAEHSMSFPESEIGYITLHIQRIYDKNSKY